MASKESSGKTRKRDIRKLISVIKEITTEEASSSLYPTMAVAMAQVLFQEALRDERLRKDLLIG